MDAHSGGQLPALGLWYVGAQLEGLVLSTHMVMGVSHRGLGYHFVLTQPQSPGLVANTDLRLQWGRR